MASAWPSYWVWSPCPWDGCILKEASSPALYVLHSGAKFHIPNSDALAAMGRRPGDYWIVGDGMLQTVVDVPWDGTLLQEAGSPTVYVVEDDPDVRDGLKDLFESVGLRSQTFDSTADFQRAKRTNKDLGKNPLARAAGSSRSNARSSDASRTLILAQ